MMNQTNAASALGAKTARACDSCLCVRARWYCAADDAFLCRACDSLVHSANQLASRHDRVRLQTSSSVKKSQTWHSGFTRKARTPRHNKNQLLQQQQQQQQQEHKEQELEKRVFFNNLPLVPELESEEKTLAEDEIDQEQLLCRVPVFDPFDAELCGDLCNEVKNEEEEPFDLDNFDSEFLPSDMDLAEFAADVESLLGKEIDENNLKGSETELLDCKEEDEIDAYVNGGIVKVKDEEVGGGVSCDLESILEMNGEGFDWNVELETIREEEEKVEVEGKVGIKKEIFLRLNYEEVIAAWDSQGGSTWTIGSPPNFNSDDCWTDFLGSSGADVQCYYGELGKGIRGHPIGSGGDGGREARVSRYREKRRTRLFAKKIRYEVRKLNAEKRPRMKGRFVKRTSLLGSSA